MSSRRDGSFVRSQRLLGIAKQIAYKISFSEDKVCEVAELLNWIMFEQGLTEKRAKEYMDIVVKAKGWVLDNGEIRTEI